MLKVFEFFLGFLLFSLLFLLVDLHFSLLRVESPSNRFGFCLLLSRLQRHVNWLSSHLSIVFLLLLLQRTRSQAIASPLSFSFSTFLARISCLSGQLLLRWFGLRNFFQEVFVIFIGVIIVKFILHDSWTCFHVHMLVTCEQVVGTKIIIARWCSLISSKKIVFSEHAAKIIVVKASILTWHLKLSCTANLFVFGDARLGSAWR